MRLVILGSATACAAMAGCVRQAEADGVVTFTPHWAEMIAPAALGLGLLGLGVPILTGKIRIRKGKPRALGTLLTFFGFLFFVATLLTYPFECVTVSATELDIASGVLGVGASTHVDLQKIERLEVSKEYRSRGGSGRRRRGRGRRLVTIVRFHDRTGNVKEVMMSGNLREAALPVLLERARGLGAKVVDHTGTFGE